MTTQTTSTDRLIATAEPSFLPLEARASVEGDRLQLRILDGAEAVHIAECPLAELQDEQRLRTWLDQNRSRLKEMGYRLDDDQRKQDWPPFG